MPWRIPFPRSEKPDRRGPYTFFKDGKTRAENWAFLQEKHGKLERLAAELRQSNMKEALHAATLVDAAAEVLFEGCVKATRKDDE